MRLLQVCGFVDGPEAYVCDEYFAPEDAILIAVSQLGRRLGVHETEARAEEREREAHRAEAGRAAEEEARASPEARRAFEAELNELRAEQERRYERAEEDRRRAKLEEQNRAQRAAMEAKFREARLRTEKDRPWREHVEKWRSFTASPPDPVRFDNVPWPPNGGRGMLEKLLGDSSAPGTRPHSTTAGRAGAATSASFEDAVVDCTNGVHGPLVLIQRLLLASLDS